MVENQKIAETIAYQEYEEELIIARNRWVNIPGFGFFGGERVNTYENYWQKLLHLARRVNEVLSHCIFARTWELHVHAFAAVNAGELTRWWFHDGEYGDSLSSHAAVLPVWHEIPVPGNKSGVLCATRNAHLQQRLNGKSLFTFYHLEIESWESRVGPIFPFHSSEIDSPAPTDED